MAVMTPQARSVQHTLETLRRLGPMTKGELCAALEVSPGGLDQRMHALRVAGLVRCIGGQAKSPRWAVVASGIPAEALQASSVWHYARRCAG